MKKNLLIFAGLAAAGFVAYVLYEQFGPGTGSLPPELGFLASVEGVPAYLSNKADEASGAILGDGWSWDSGDINTGIIPTTGGIDTNVLSV